MQQMREPPEDGRRPGPLSFRFPAHVRGEGRSMESVVPVPRIRILTEDAAEKAEYELGGGRITIGRSAENNIVLQDSLVSRHHAELEFDGQSVHLRDVGGKNPIRVNGSEVQDYRLLHGD